MEVVFLRLQRMKILAKERILEKKAAAEEQKAVYTEIDSMHAELQLNLEKSLTKNLQE
jgi:hypothetical protein